MKRSFLIAAMVLGFVFVANSVFGNFYVIPTRPQVAGTAINSVPYTISSSGFYYVTKDLYLAEEDGLIAIEITADNVTLDLMGFKIHCQLQSGGRTGIFINGADSVEIRNGIVRDCTQGIVSTEDAKNHRILGVRVLDNIDYSIRLQGTNHSVRECLVCGNGYGIDISGSNHLIKDSTVSNNNLGCGISVETACTVTGNVVCNNGPAGAGVGISGISASFGCTVTGNTVYANSLHGITAMSGCTVAGNTVYFNNGYGIQLLGACLVDGNTAYENNKSGGAYSEINYTCATCVFGTNYPAP